ncbi:MAG: hypothetical protein QNJ13_10925 [Paracoccaceae bacterium]|nr:hypothetical protein [Paracoccaceae bacterium]
MSDPFEGHQPSLESPALHVAEVTPDDAADLAWPSRALNVAQTGTVRVTTIGGETGTVYVAAGALFPIRVSRIWATGTTATGIVALC